MTSPAVHTRLRKAFERRDRIAAQLAEQDRKIAAGIRALCDATGEKFMRVERARALVFGAEEGEAA